MWASSLILAAGAASAAPHDPREPGRYLAAQLADAEAALGAGRPDEALDGVDRVLSLVAALENPEADPTAVALALSRSTAILLAVGHADRAIGLRRAAGGFVDATLSGRDARGARHALVRAHVHEAEGDLARAFEAAADSAARFRSVGAEDAALQASAFVAATCLALDRQDCPEGSMRTAIPPGEAGRTARLELAASLAAMDRSRGQAGAWGRPGGLERWALRQVLTEATALQAQPAFVLFQVAGRGAASFDADALSALAQAPTEAARRSIHQTLRLRARRDRLERAQIQHVVALAARPAPPGPLRYDAARRLVFRDFAHRLRAAESEHVQGGASLSGANLADLSRFQAVLAPDEAALSVAPTTDGFAYMCIRRDRTFLASRRVEAARFKLDGRLVGAALTATHAPSEASDTQFPVPAAVRLYDDLIRPFEGCLKPGDRIVWLSGVAEIPVPLAALLRDAPPRLAVGYDLAQADWLVRRHAVSYAGSAAALIAARTGPARNGAAFDFLGVGDPLLTGQTAEGQARSRAILRGVRGEDLAELAPLPETREELEASARSFRRTRLLLRDEATERRLRGELVGAYRYLSFATHGLIRDDLQGLAEPALVLTPVSMADPTDDGLLTASEIADLQLAASFVALSACNTANFDLTQMVQDLPALASAFAVAGTPSTLATLWPVNSDTGKRVVSDAFARLGDGGPAEALARAQRAFLADPPSRAYLHPRFWAPFVVLGEGGPPRRDAATAAPRVLAAETLTSRGGEVLHVARRPDGVVARFISDRDAAGRHGAGLRLASANGESWRRDTRDVAASRFAAETGDGLMVSGYLQTPEGRFAPVLELYDGAGERRGQWLGADLSDTHAFVFAGTRVNAGEAVVLVAELRAEGRGPRLTLLAVDAALAPRTITEIETPLGAELQSATVTPLGGDLIVTYSAAGPRPPPAAYPVDDYDLPLCRPERVTWIERRDGRTGELKSRRLVRGLNVVAALAQRGQIWLAGSTAEPCSGEARASLVAIDGALQTRSAWTDQTLGASEARALAGLPNGRSVVAVSKETVFDFRTPALPGPTADPYRLGDLPKTFGGMVLVLDRDGRASAPRMIEAGGSVFVTALDASDPEEILLGGTLGGEAAIFRLAPAGP